MFPEGAVLGKGMLLPRNGEAKGFPEDDFLDVVAKLRVVESIVFPLG